jgi:mRNA interferase HicA
MKCKDLRKNGWWFVREGSNHTVYTNGEASEQIPRHNEVNERLATAIIKRQRLK